MLRRMFADFMVDDERYPDLNKDLEKKLKTLKRSGLYLEEWALADQENSSQWSRYIGYIMSWAMTHAGNAYEGMTPACFDEWRDCEGQNEDELVMQLEKDNVRAEWVNIGEGVSGDYDPEDPNDIQLLRFEISIRDEEEWVEVDDSSYCTQMPADTPNKILERALQVILDEYVSALRAHPGASVKKLGERLSWISPNDFIEKDT